MGIKFFLVCLNVKTIAKCAFGKCNANTEAKERLEIIVFDLQ